MPRLPKGQGRKKTANEKIENPKRLEVSFCKRRSGIFKKATELCILCGCYVAVILSSMKKKLFSFGHTSAELVSSRFIHGDSQQHRLNPQSSEILLDEDFELNEVIVEDESYIGEEKTKSTGETLIPQEDGDNNCRYWWLLQQEGLTMTLEELEKMEANACEFKNALWSPHTQGEYDLSFEWEALLTPGDQDLYSSFLNS